MHTAKKVIKSSAILIMMVVSGAFFSLTSCAGTTGGTGSTGNADSTGNTGSTGTTGSTGGTSSSSGGTESTTSIYSTATDLGNWSSFTIGASYFSKFTEGSKIIFTTTASTAVTSPAYLNLKLYYTWSNVIDAGSCSGGTISGEVIVLSSAEGTVTYTVTAAEAAGLVANGLIVQGYGITVTDVSIYVPSATTYTVTFNSKSGTVVASQTVNKGSSIATSPTTTRDGYSFSGWYESVLYSGSAVTFPYTPASSITLYAKWTSTGATTATATSTEFAKKLTIGWNLGNTLDASSDGVSNSGVSSETSWSAPTTTEEMIKGIASAGFKTIRIPITWHNHMSNASTYTIDATWMARVKTVVDWAYDAGLYVIINVHHDTAAATGVVAGQGYYPASDDQTISETFVSKVWTQIATEFNNDYDEHLVFEVLNEPRLRGNTNNHEWWYDSSSTECTKALTLIEDYEQKGLDAIRATGGNNASVRFVMVPSMCASSTYTSDFKLPTDTASDKLLVSVHAYSPYNFAMYNSTGLDTKFDDADKTSLNSMFKTWYDAFTAKGIGVVIGETSASNKDNLAERVKWTTYYFGTALNTYGIPSVLWDNMAYTSDTTSSEQHGYYNRSAQTWYFPTIITAAMDAVGVTGYTVN
jgi:endoglucanase